VRPDRAAASGTRTSEAAVADRSAARLAEGAARLAGVVEAARARSGARVTGTARLIAGAALDAFTLRADRPGGTLLAAATLLVHPAARFTPIVRVANRARIAAHRGAAGLRGRPAGRALPVRAQKPLGTLVSRAAHLLEPAAAATSSIFASVRVGVTARATASLSGTAARNAFAPGGADGARLATGFVVAAGFSLAAAGHARPAFAKCPRVAAVSATRLVAVPTRHAFVVRARVPARASRARVRATRLTTAAAIVPVVGCPGVPGAPRLPYVPGLARASTNVGRAAFHLVGVGPRSAARPVRVSAAASAAAALPRKIVVFVVNGAGRYE
jgi:hypothetical protein